MRSAIALTCVMVTAAATAQDFKTIRLGGDDSLNFPWEITYGPADMLWVTERAGAPGNRHPG